MPINGRKQWRVACERTFGEGLVPDLPEPPPASDSLAATEADRSNRAIRGKLNRGAVLLAVELPCFLRPLFENEALHHLGSSSRQLRRRQRLLRNNERQARGNERNVRETDRVVRENMRDMRAKVREIQEKMTEKSERT